MRWKFWKRDASVAEEIEDKPVAKPRFQAAVRRTFSGLVLFVLVLQYWVGGGTASLTTLTSAQPLLASANAKQHQVVTGYITTATVIQLADTLLTKRGGYLSNDLAATRGVNGQYSRMGIWRSDSVAGYRPGLP